MYLDVIFFENLIINYVILILTKKFSKRPTNYIKLFLGASVGASYVVLFFLLPYKIIYSVTAKIVLSFLIIYMAFNPKTLKEFLRVLAVFYMISFLIGGAIFALLYMVKFDLNVIVMGFLMAILLLYTNWEYIVRKSRNDKLIYNIRIEVLENHAQIKALLDTGNRLYDPLTKLPVVVVEFRAIKDLLPKTLGNLSEDDIGDFDKVSEMFQEEKWINRLRLIPFMSVGQNKGMMVGFRPDKLVIEEEKKEIRDVIIGVYQSKLNKYGDYAALIAPEILS
ncbi:sigma-E processing peptidase SpoIIGA [Thermoanaerobacter kivui]|nr:sigma-E processing peptidase SpoIIGA [Thermoanaerobacter kivui]